ncbi:MAG: PAS domain S-box protein [Syntrophales bacterium]
MTDTSPFLGLVHNAALLLTIAYLFDVSAAHWKTERQSFRLASFGIIIGAVGIVVMMTSWTLMPGLIFDTRSVLLSISGLFFGFVPTVVAMAMTAALRIYQGGPGAIMGVSVIIATGAIGILWRKKRLSALAGMSWRELYFFGILTHLVMLALTFTMPVEIALRTLSRISLPVLLIYPVGTALLGMLMVNRLQRQHADENLQESEEKYRSLFDYSRDAILLTKPDGSILDANPSACEMFGRSLEGMKSVGRDGLVDTTDPRLLESLQKRQLTGGGMAEITMLRAGGDKFPAEVTSTVFADASGQQKTSMIIRDVTERKRAEESLRQSEDKFTSIFKILPNGISIARLRDGFIIETNEGFKEITGWERDEVLGRTSLEINFWHDPADRTFLVEALQAGRAVLQREFQFRRKDGTLRFGVYSARFIRIAGEECIVFVTQDITERKQTERALQESEASYRHLFEHSPAGTYRIDFRNGKFERANDIFCRYVGYSKEEIASLSPYDLLTEESKKLFLERLERMAQGMEVPETVEYEIVCKDGKQKSVHLYNRSIYDAEGNVVASDVAAHDITERKKAEKALRKSEAYYRAITENASDILVISDMDGIITYASPSVERIAGYRPEEMMGTNFFELIVSEDIPRVMEDFARALQTQNMYIPNSFRIRHKNGSELVLEGVGANLLNDPTLKGFVMSARDITERRRAEEELQEYQRRLSDIIEFLPDATLVIDSEGRVIAWNRAIETITGVKKEEMLGKGDYEYSIPFYGERRRTLIDLALHPDPEKEKECLTIRRTGDIIMEDAHTHALSHGNVYLSGTASVLRNSEGKIVGAIECIRDFTDRKIMEDRLQRAEKMESLGILAGGVAHDLNNVLGVLVGYSELLLRDLPEGSRAEKHARNILLGGERAAAIIQDLLTMARRGVSVSETVNLNRIVTDCFKTPEFELMKAHHPDVLFKNRMEKDLFNIKGSPVHLSKSIMNLLSNAAEAIKGEGTVTITTENRYVDVAIPGYENTQEGEYVVLTITDTGSGISPEDMGRIFEPFYTKKVMGRSGTGLGLAVVWGTVKDHSGYIDIRTELNQGTSFVLYFPVTRDALLKTDQALAESEYRGRGESILIVDDAEEQRHLAATILEGLNYRVTSVAGGEEALEYLCTNKADLVILDMIMDPGIDGLETYRRILEIQPKQRAIIVSGFAKTDRVKMTQDLGAGEYVMKPYIIEKLGMAVRRELDKI